MKPRAFRLHGGTHQYLGHRHGRASRLASKLPRAITLRRLERLLKGAGAALILLLLVAPSWAQTPNPVVPAQREPYNSGVLTSAANTAVAHTMTGLANTRVRIMSFKASCSAGTATVTIADGATTIWSTVTGAIGTTDGGAIWFPALSLTAGNTGTVTLGTCGVGNVGKLTVQADRW